MTRKQVWHHWFKHVHSDIVLYSLHRTWIQVCSLAVSPGTNCILTAHIEIVIHKQISSLRKSSIFSFILYISTHNISISNHIHPITFWTIYMPCIPASKQQARSVKDAHKLRLKPKVHEQWSRGLCHSLHLQVLSFQYYKNDFNLSRELEFRV